MTDNPIYHYDCTMCGITSRVNIDADTLRFCPACGDPVDERDIEEIDSDEYYDD